MSYSVKDANGNLYKVASTPIIDNVLSSSSKNAIMNRAVYAALQSKIEASVDSLVNYYLKSETYSKDEVDDIVSAISTLTIKVVEILPVSDISTSTLYFVGPETGTNNYTQYVYVDENWVSLGSTSVDLSDYITDDDLEIAIADFMTENDIEALLTRYYTKTEIDSMIRDFGTEDLKDVSINYPTNGQFLRYDSGIKKWVNGVTGLTIDTLDSIGDVAIEDVEDGQIIVWNAENARWENADLTQVSYTAGYGIDIDNNEISKSDFVGTLAEWEALTPEEQVTYDSVGITDDFKQNTDVEVAYVDDLPTANIKDIVYGLREHINTSYTVADGFLDSDPLFNKATTADGYIYTPAEPLQAGIDGVNYELFDSLEYDGTDFVMTYDGGSTDTLSIGDEFYYRFLGEAVFYIGSALDQRLHLLYNVDSDDVPTRGSQRLIKSGGVYNALSAKADSATTLAGYGITNAYTKTEIDNLFAEHESNVTWKAAVATYADIATTYPNPQPGWTVVANDTNTAYRYTSEDGWVAISANATPEATTEVNGLMTTTMVTKLNGIATGAEVNQNAFSGIKVGTSTIAADGKTDIVEFAGSNVTLTPDLENDKLTIGITKNNVVTALGYTPPTTDTDTHRPIQVNGTQVLASNTTPLNLKAGSNVTLSNSSGTVTIAATDTTYSSKSAASGGTAVSLCTTGEKYIWNNKQSLLTPTPITGYSTHSTVVHSVYSATRYGNMVVINVILQGQNASINTNYNAITNLPKATYSAITSIPNEYGNTGTVLLMIDGNTNILKARFSHANNYYYGQIVYFTS